MDASPDEESPRGAVPETAEEHGEEKVPIGTRVAEAITPEGDVEVITQPRGKGDVPATPEVGQGSCEVGRVEIFREDEAEHEAKADGHVGVSAEVEVDLHRVTDSAEPCVGGSPLGSVEGDVSDVSAGVRQNDFFGESEEEKERAAREMAGGFRAVAELVREEGELEDGARNKVREHRGEAGEIDEVFHRCCVATIDVDDVTQCLEGVETDAEGEGEMDGGNPFGRELKCVAEMGEGCEAEIAVFEESEGREVADDGQGDRVFLATRTGNVFLERFRGRVRFPRVPVIPGNHEAQEPVERRCREHEQDEDGFGPAVEGVAGEGEPKVPLSGRPVSQEEVAEEGEREEAVDENMGTENHPRGAANQRRTLGM